MIAAIYEVEENLYPIENEELFEGDMLGIRSAEDLKSATTDLDRLWPGAQIPYVISASYGMNISQLIRK